ncbi:MAG: MliC family protein [Candidatus Peribacteria bacterium]|jgi:membrane-bound inhibitor of C-type lysozyme|nr:MliC family protein [Candidatus Peribacteria bacterium]
MACLNQTTPAWSCVQRDSLIKFLNGQDLTDYFAIKAGRLTPEAIQIVRDAIQTFTDRFEFNDEKAINLEFLVTAIEAYKTNLMNQNTKNLQLKLDILSLLRFEAIREMNVLLAVGEPIPVSSINLEFTCDNNERFFVEIDGDTLTLNDNRTRRFYTLNRVESADGEKFQDEINVVWIKGNDATFTRNGQDFYTNCTVVN